MFVHLFGRVGRLDFGRFHIIESGTVVVTVKEGAADREVNQLTVGQYFGEVTLRGDTLPTATVLAQGNVDTLSLDRASFNRLLGSETVQVTSLSDLRAPIRSV